MSHNASAVMTVVMACELYLQVSRCARARPQKPCKRFRGLVAWHGTRKEMRLDGIHSRWVAMRSGLWASARLE